MKAKSLMILGTASGVGKSLITAGFCRLFSDWGYRVAPFKAQNMSNNSFVTTEGEIGRAQAVQAECARLIPTVDMNPVLLKPAADNGSQVIVHGIATGHFTAREYYSEKEKVRKAIQTSYEKLARDYEMIVIEGAGSPAEINLKDCDLVNMEMAKMAQARCVLVGDIERGGVFASLIGTLELLNSEERNRIEGFIINKFRGDQSLLKSGLDFIEKRSGKKVWGVLPFDRDLWIESEDAMNLRHSEAEGRRISAQRSFAEQGSAQDDALDIAIISLPHLSNFTDFEVLRQEPGVSLRYIHWEEDFGFPDLLILPGTKATIADFNYLTGQGFREKILEFASQGGRILGICGGYQMMGEIIRDSAGIESKGEMDGLGFFKLETEFFPEKVLRQVGHHLDLSLWGRRVKGYIQAYEIHMGRTQYKESYPPFGEGGAIHPNGLWAGTYYHGLFDHHEFRSSFLSTLAEAVGKKRPAMERSLDIRELKELHYERLKNLLTQNLNLDFLRECLHLPAPSCLTS